MLDDMAMYVRFECGQEDRVSHEYGPFPFVQATFEMLRVGPNGDALAHYDAESGVWVLDGDLLVYARDAVQKWSDVIIYNK